MKMESQVFCVLPSGEYAAFGYRVIPGKMLRGLSDYRGVSFPLVQSMRNIKDPVGKFHEFLRMNYKNISSNSCVIVGAEYFLIYLYKKMFPSSVLEGIVQKTQKGNSYLLIPGLTFDVGEERHTYTLCVSSVFNVPNITLISGVEGIIDNLS